MDERKSAVRVVLATQPEIAQHLQPHFEQHNIVVTSNAVEETEILPAIKLTTSSIVVLSTYIFKGTHENAEVEKLQLERLLYKLREMRIRVILICPEKEWLLSWMDKGFFDFVLDGENGFDESGLISMIFTPRSIDKARQALNWKPLVQEDPESTVPVSSKKNHLTYVARDDDEDEVAAKSVKIVSFWSSHPGTGRGTLARLSAIETAKRGFRTALVEWDILHSKQALSIGLSHPTRNLENWAIKSNASKEERGIYRNVKDFILNSNLWLQDMSKDKKMLVPVVRDLPTELYLLTPSDKMDIFQPVNLRLKTDMPYFIVEELVSLGFQAIFFDVPPEILLPVSGASLKLSDDVYVVLNGDIARSISTKQAIQRIERDLDTEERIHLVLNGVPDHLYPHIGDLVGRKPWIAFPYDETMPEHSHDLTGTAGNAYVKVLDEFIDRMGFLRKGKKPTVFDNDADKPRMSFDKEPKSGLSRLLSFTK